MLVRRRPKFDEFPRHFHVPFRCNFADRKIHVVSAFFFQYNFGGRKIQLISTYFFKHNFAGRNIHIFSTYLSIFSTYVLGHNIDGQKFDDVFG